MLHDYTFLHGYNITDCYHDFNSFGNHPATSVHLPYMNMIYQPKKDALCFCLGISTPTPTPTGELNRRKEKQE